MGRREGGRRTLCNRYPSRQLESHLLVPGQRPVHRIPNRAFGHNNCGTTRRWDSPRCACTSRPVAVEGLKSIRQAARDQSDPSSPDSVVALVRFPRRYACMSAQRPRRRPPAHSPLLPGLAIRPQLTIRGDARRAHGHGTTHRHISSHSFIPRPHPAFVIPSPHVGAVCSICLHTAGPCRRPSGPDPVQYHSCPVRPFPTPVAACGSPRLSLVGLESISPHLRESFGASRRATRLQPSG